MNNEDGRIETVETATVTLRFRKRDGTRKIRAASYWDTLKPTACTEWRISEHFDETFKNATFVEDQVLTIVCGTDYADYHKRNLQGNPAWRADMHDAAKRLVLELQPDACDLAFHEDRIIAIQLQDIAAGIATQAPVNRYPDCV